MYFSNEASNRVECLQWPENRGPYINLIENHLYVVGAEVSGVQNQHEEARQND
jgi:hypothetical protein